MPDPNLMGIADVVDRCNLAARKLLPVLMRQHQQLERLNVRAALGTKGMEFGNKTVAQLSVQSAISGFTVNLLWFEQIQGGLLPFSPPFGGSRPVWGSRRRTRLALLA